MRVNQMNGRVFLAALLLSSLWLSVNGQQPQQPPRPSPSPAQQNPRRDEDQDVVRITTNLVQVDVGVTRGNKPVTDLKMEDFEIFEDGRPQTITNFSYISNVRSTPPAKVAVESNNNEKTPSPMPPGAISSREVRRTVALVVDDLGMSFESISQLRLQLRKFLEGLSPNDLVAIIRTGGDVGALQQFTTDRRLLQSAVDHVRWNPCSRTGIYVFAPVGPVGSGIGTGQCAHNLTGTLKILRFVLRGMGSLPGRKSLVLFSDDLPIEDQGPRPLEFQANKTLDSSQADPSTRANKSSDEQSEGVTPNDPGALNDADIWTRGSSYVDQLQRLAELAIRGSVVIYAVDTRGLQYTGPTAADSITGARDDLQEKIGKITSSRSQALLRGREGSDSISRQTGGFLIRNSNDFRLERVMEDQQGYYLIGFRPSEETFKRDFHHLKVRVKHKGLTVRTRAGFYGFTDEEARPPEATVQDRMNKALISPFGANDFPVRLTTFFVDERTMGPQLRSFLYLDPRDLTFTEETDGWRVANFDLRGILFGDNGRVINEQSQAATLRLRKPSYDQAVRDGIVLGFDLPVKRYGAFQFRVALRDMVSSRLGAGGQFVEIPNLRNGQLALSGIIVREESTDGNAAAASMTRPSSSDQAGATSTPPPPSNNRQESAGYEAITGGPGVRRFHQGASLIFAYVAYNANLDSAAHLPQLTTEARLFRDGKPISTIDPTPLNAQGQLDPQRVTQAFALKLGSELSPGEYILQIIVNDHLGKEKPRLATQWIDFEVMK
jgi:VWFA-related protein